MSRPSRAQEIARFLAAPGRVASRKELSSRFGRKSLEAAHHRGLVVELLPGQFVHARFAGDFATRINAVVAWMPRYAAVSGLAALRLYELRDSVAERITVVAPRHHHVRGPSWVRVVRSSAIGRVQVRDSVRCTSRERAVIEAWREAPPRDRVSTVLEALRRSSLTGTRMLDLLDTLPRVPGRRELVRILDEAANGIQSYLEHRAHRTVLNTADFRGLQRQVEVFAMGKRYVLDTYDPVTRTVIEFDGAKVHGSREAKQRDNRRDAALLSLGIATIRIGYDDVISRPAWCREVIRRALAARASGPQVLPNAL